jgi:prepilin-type N-terminal cleavage/methylation domain-containing protein
MSRHRFTLIELLVVVAIIAILAAILLPALGKARLKSKRLLGQVNMSQMVIGFTMYADDNEGQLPRSNRNSWGFGPWYWMMDTAQDQFDNRQIAIDYGFVPSTAHPVIDSPAINDPVNTNASYNAATWHYLPGYYSPAYKAQTEVAAGPLALADGDSKTSMMQDMMILAWGHAPPLRYQGIQMARIGVRRVEGGPTNPSHVFFGAASASAADILGAYNGSYDGAVRFRPTHQFQWAIWNGWGGGLYFAHAQGLE